MAVAHTITTVPGTSGVVAIIEAVIGALALLLPLELAAAGPLLANAYADGPARCCVWSLLGLWMNFLLLRTSRCRHGGDIPTRFTMDGAVCQSRRLDLWR